MIICRVPLKGRGLTCGFVAHVWKLKTGIHF